MALPALLLSWSSSKPVPSPGIGTDRGSRGTRADHPRTGDTDDRKTVEPEFLMTTAADDETHLAVLRLAR